jgi:hypothetical protein
MIQVGNTFHNTSISSIVAFFEVPNSPSVSDPSDQLFYWIGAANCSGTPTNLMQPVVAWNYPQYPLQWVGFAMWVWTNDAIIGEIIPLQSGDTISMSITIGSEFSEIFLKNLGNGDISFLKYTPGTSRDPPPPIMCTALANLENGNHVTDPADTPCSYPPNTVKFTGFEAYGSDGTYLTSLSVIYYNGNNNVCQLNATTSPLTSTSWEIDFSAGIYCNGENYNNSCCGGEPLPSCSTDSTSCWVNPFSCKDYINNVCCIS